MDEIARRLGMDPLALRLKNIVPEGERLITQRVQSRNGAREVLTALTGHPAWTDRPSPGRGDDGLLHGTGVALGDWGSGRWPASAMATLEAEGTSENSFSLTRHCEPPRPGRGRGGP